MAKRPTYKKRFSLLEKFYREQEAKRYWKSKYLRCSRQLVEARKELRKR